MVKLGLERRQDGSGFWTFKLSERVLLLVFGQLVRQSLTIGLVLTVQSALPRERVTPDLEKAMTSTQGLIRVNVVLEERLNAARLRALTSGRNKIESREIVVRELKRFAHESQGELLACLFDLELRGQVEQIRPLWLNNVVCCRATQEVIEKVSEMEGVRSVDLDEERRVITGLRREEQIGQVGVEWNIARINAPAAWILGYTGQGVVVGLLDTGVNYDHLDLADHIWINSDEVPGNGADDDSNNYVDDYYGYDFYNRDEDPTDDYGHGSASAGIIAGDGTGGDTTGVARDAELMCLKVTDWRGYAFESDMWEAIQYAVANGADVLNLSLGWMHSWNPDRRSWRDALNSALAGGVVVAVAGGNERGVNSPPDAIRTPGDVPPPWRNPQQDSGGLSAVVTVGATNMGANDPYAWFSSPGPVTWETVAPFNDYPYPPGLIDPDVCAPGAAAGAGIMSIRHDENSGYTRFVAGAPAEGTSFSAAHVSGAAALLLSKDSELTPAMVDSILETTSLDLGPPGKDDDYGAGRVDLLEAIGVAVDLDVDDNSDDLSGNTMHLYGSPGGEVFGQYSMINPNSFQSNPDESDGPGNSDIDSIRYRATDLVTPGGLHTIPASSVEPDGRGIDSLLYGDRTENLVAVAIPSNLPCFPDYAGRILVVGWASDSADTDQFTLKVTVTPPRLWQNYPNPFRGRTEIPYLISSGLEKVSLKVYNLSGAVVRTLVSQAQEGGYHSAFWDGRDSSGRQAASEVYFYRIETDGFAETKKMVLLK